MKRITSTIGPLLALFMLGMALPAVAAEPTLTVVDRDDDVRIQIGDPGRALSPLATDPLGLVVGVDTLRDHSLGPDVLDVWICGIGGSASTFAAELDATVGEWYAFHSRDRYDPVFVARGNAGSDPQGCEDHSTANAGGNANGAIHLTPGGGGFAGPGFVCGFTPCPGSELYGEGNRRNGFIGVDGGFHSTAAHEMGHMIQWPHSTTGADPNWPYDNALDLMSGNYGVTGNSYGSFDDPYSTAVINFYAAGWIDPHEVYVFSGGGASLNLATAGGEGFKMAVIGSGSRYFTLAARVPSTQDPIPGHWSGVEVYEVEKCVQSEFDCLNGDLIPGFRRITPHPAVPFDYSNIEAYDDPLPHVIVPGSSRQVGGVEVTVGTVTGQAMAVSIGPNPQPLPNPVPIPLPSFTDTSGHVFQQDIEWLAASGITRGCNPPVNSRFCPNDSVTRGQMAAFLHRALPDLAVGATVDFADDDNSTFEADIEWLAATGVTRGCNPPANTSFCPGDVVTRGQMAAFLHRALPDLAVGATVDFADDDNSTFEADIEWLAATGVTRGCNPPANTSFCPAADVTRGAMAAFLHRALDG